MFRLDTLGSVQGHAGQGVLTATFHICEVRRTQCFVFVEHHNSTSIRQLDGIPAPGR